MSFRCHYSGCQPWFRRSPRQRATPGTAGPVKAHRTFRAFRQPDQVSGGDARIAIEAPPGQRTKLSLTLNGAPLDLGDFEGWAEAH